VIIFSSYQIVFISSEGSLKGYISSYHIIFGLGLSLTTDQIALACLIFFITWHYADLNFIRLSFVVDGKLKILHAINQFIVRSISICFLILHISKTFLDLYLFMYYLRTLSAFTMASSHITIDAMNCKKKNVKVNISGLIWVSLFICLEWRGNSTKNFRQDIRGTGLNSNPAPLEQKSEPWTLQWTCLFSFLWMSRLRKISNLPHELMMRKCTVS
jgi:hypothetical protein